MGWLAPVKERAAKANFNPTGPGAYSMTYLQPVDRWTEKRSGPAFMRKAQELYHTHPWIGAAENTVSTRVASVPWHLEDGEDNEVTDKSPEPYRKPRDLLQKPLGDIYELVQELGFMPASPSTWRDLAKLTVRHGGLCGIGFWFLDKLDGLAKTPERLFYINPARMQPALDKGDNLIGWKLDLDEATGKYVPLDIIEVLPIRFDPPDRGYMGVGNVERAMRKAQLTDSADTHGLGVLGSGGRLSGMVSPKQGDRIEDDEVWEELVRNFRNANEYPDAAKRMLVLRRPIDFIPNAATPEQLDLVAMNTMGRDDVLAVWGVPYSQIGGTAPAGFGGEVRTAEEAALWAGACGPRMDALIEAVQYGLLDRWVKLGVTVEFEDDRPSFDDDAPKWNVAQTSINVAISNDERRALVGLPPLEDEILGAQIWVASNLQELSSAPKNPIPPLLAPFTGVPGLTAAAPAPPMPMTPQDNLPPPAKASLHGLQSLGDKFRPDIARAVQKVLDAQAKEIASRVEANAAHVQKKPTDTSVWWNGDKWDSALLAALEPEAVAVDAAVRERVAASLSHRHRAHKASVPKWLANLAKRVTNINQTTRDKIAAVIAANIGLGGAELGKLVAQATAFTSDRGELIARTETGTYLNQSQAAQFGEYGVEKVEIIDGDGDDICATADGQIWTLEEFDANPLGHPNCTRDAAPVLT